MAGRFGYARDLNATDPLLSAVGDRDGRLTTQGAMNNRVLHEQLQGMMNRDIRMPDAASAIQKMVRGKRAINAAKAKLEAKRVRKQLTNLQYKTYRFTDESKPAAFNSRTRKSRKKAKKRRRECRLHWEK